MNAEELHDLIDTLEKARKYFCEQRELYANMADDCRLSGNVATARAYEEHMEEAGTHQGNMLWALKTIKHSEVTLR